MAAPAVLRVLHDVEVVHTVAGRPRALTFTAGTTVRVASELAARLLEARVEVTEVDGVRLVEAVEVA